MLENTDMDEFLKGLYTADGKTGGPMQMMQGAHSGMPDIQFDVEKQSE